MRTRTRWPILAAALAMSSSAAFAHPGHPGHEGFNLWAGVAHPFTGADHMLAMVAVGLWAALRGGKALWAWPAAFVAALIVGFAIGKTGVSVPLAEPMILASIIALGGLTAVNAKVPTLAGVALIAVFGAAHGFAHGTETPGATLGFPLGMALATLALHGAGLAAGLGLQRLRRPALVRLLGAGAALGGLALGVAG
jgi:urease accessory protein